MGFLSALKQMFSNNIVINPDEYEDVTTLYDGRAVKLKIGANVVIENKATLVVVYKNKPRDIISGKGKYRITEDNFPELFKCINLSKNPKRIKAKLYFVKSGLIEKFPFASSQNFMVKSKDLGRISGGVEGICKVSINDVKDFMHWLFSIKRSFNVGEIDYLLSCKIGDVISKIIEKSKIDIREIVLRNHNLNEYLNVEVVDIFEKLGFEIKDIEVKGMEFDKKSKYKIDAILERQYERIDKTKSKYMTLTTANGDNVMEIARDIEVDMCKCPSCGKEFDTNFDFCPYCGKRVK
ncbi:MAG: SPFH domain-containing protein [Clostridia bacterium]|nr:SPFH domain-containing protein [Clostridia bacterium]